MAKILSLVMQNKGLFYLMKTSNVLVNAQVSFPLFLKAYDLFKLISNVTEIEKRDHVPQLLKRSHLVFYIHS